MDTVFKTCFFSDAYTLRNGYMPSVFHTQRFLTWLNSAASMRWYRYVFSLLMLPAALGLFVLYAQHFPEQVGVYYAGCLLLAASPLLAAVKLLARYGLDRLSVGMFIAASIISLHYIYISNDNTYTHDLEQHVARIDYTMKNWLHPYGYPGSALDSLRSTLHPPVYYYPAAVVLNITQSIGLPKDPTGIRVLSWSMFLLFSAYNLLTLRLMASSNHLAYYASAATVTFWPMALFIGTEISPSSLWYGLYPVAFYYMVRWQKNNDTRSFLIAWFWSAVALAVRSNSVFLFLIAFLLMIKGMRNGTFTLERRLLKPYAALTLFTVTCFLINCYRMLIGETPTSLQMGLGEGMRFAPDYGHYLYFRFSNFFTSPFPEHSWEEPFLGFVLKSALYSEYSWPWPVLAGVLNAHFMLMMLYVIVAFAITPASQRRQLTIFTLALWIPFAMLVVYSTHAKWWAYQNARYILPSIVCLGVFYMRSIEVYRMRGWKCMPYAGYSMAFSFALISAIFFWCNGR